MPQPERSLEFMTGNPQLGVLSGRLTYYLNINDNTTAKNSKRPNKKSRADTKDRDYTADDDYVAVRTSAGATPDPPVALPESRSTLLCILSVPAHMIPTDMLQFVAPFKDEVHFVRILRPCNPVGPSDPERTPAEYMVLLQMGSQDSADDLFLQCNGKRFNSFEEASCRVVFVATAKFDIREAGVVSATTTTTSTATAAAPAGAAGGAAGATSSRATTPTIAAPTFESSPSPCTGKTSDKKQAFEAGSPPTTLAGTDPPVSPLRPASAAMRFAPMARASSGGGGNGAAGGVISVGVAGGPGSGGVGLSQGEASASASAAVATAAEWSYDASTCVICMDRMESNVLTTVCNHSFHVECLVKWKDSPCPVCRFHHNNASEASTCQECQATDNLWVCLICGSVLCGSRHEDHVRSHYTNTLHAYALEIETQQVWDFAGDGFVHRLIHNKADGKLVEIPDPGQTSEERPQVPARLSDVQEERLVHGKLEGLAYQYNTLLTSQLDEQRQFYQKQLNGLLEQQEKDRRDRRENVVSGADLISALRQERRELDNKCASASERLKKVRDETAFLWELNKSLEANKEQWTASLEQAQRELDTATNTRERSVPQLEEKVAQLMLKLDAAAASGAVGGESGAGASGASSTGCAGSGVCSGGSVGGEGGDNFDEAMVAGAAGKGGRGFAGVGECWGGVRSCRLEGAEGGKYCDAGQRQGPSGGGVGNVGGGGGSGKKKNRRKKGK